MPKKRTHEEYVEELAIKNPTVVVLGEYVDAKTPILHHCLMHDVVWNITPSDALRGSGCYECRKIKIGNSHRKTLDKYKEDLFNINPNIEVLDTDYINAKIPMLHQCKIDGYQWYARPYNTLSGVGCPMCAKRVRRTTQQYVDELDIINPNIEVLGDYINAKTPILHRCKIDGYEWMASPGNIIAGYGCPICGHKRLSELLKKTHEEYATEVAKINPDIEIIGQYDGANIPILHRCKIDSCEWMARPANILLGQGCPQCQESKGERIIRQWLEFHKIQYIYQHKFQDCKDINPLPFDFYLPEHNICIEYNGEQHYIPVDFAGKGQEWAEQQLNKTQTHDQIKSQYCEDNNIRLLVIPYYKNIEEELNNFLFI